MVTRTKGIWFRVGKVKDDLLSSRIKNNQYVAIMQGEKQIGRIFSPSGSLECMENVIQVCGFSDAFDLWGCKMDGFKDIQLLFDEKQYSSNVIGIRANCDRCFSTPCACEVPDGTDTNPFTVKRERTLKGRIKYTKEYLHATQKGKDALRG